MSAYPLEAAGSVGAFVIFRCSYCTCTNTAWENSDRMQAILASEQLTPSHSCTNSSCRCHSGYVGKIQSKRIDIGEEAPF